MDRAIIEEILEDLGSALQRVEAEFGRPETRKR